MQELLFDNFFMSTANTVNVIAGSDKKVDD